MKPRNKKEKAIMELVAKLRPLNARQIKQFHAELKKYRFTSSWYRKIHCMECGQNVCTCPTKEKEKEVYTHHIDRLYHGRKNETIYLAITSVVREYQVVRYFDVNKTMTINEKAIYHKPIEVAQHWINDKGQCTYVGKLRGMYGNGFAYNSQLEIRCNVPIYPEMTIVESILPIFNRNGFKGDLHKISPFKMFTSLLTDSKAETLIKTDQIDALRYHLYTRNLSGKWNEFKLAVRNGFKFTKESMTRWADYIEMLKQFKHKVEDYYPIDIDKAHKDILARIERKRNRQLERIRRLDKIEQELQLAKLKKDIAKNDRAYKKAKSKYFGFMIHQDNLLIRPLKSVREFEQCGNNLKHCVFEREYYKMDNSLILGAWVQNELVENIEVNLNTLEIEQARGYDNTPSKYNDLILTTLASNLSNLKTA